jgi:hypothetical protein
MASFEVETYEVEVGNLRSKPPLPEDGGAFEFPEDMPDTPIVARVACRPEDKGKGSVEFLFAPVDVPRGAHEAYGHTWVILPETLLGEFLATLRYERPIHVRVEDWGDAAISATWEPPGEQEDIDRFL